MFGSGWVELASGDPTWRRLTELASHYETKPLPTPRASWYAHRLTAHTATALAIELAIVPRS